MTDERATTTEEAPEAPGWAEVEVDRILGEAFGETHPAGLAALRASYLDCLAGIGGAQDLDRAHDRCRKALLTGLTDASVPDDRRRRIDQALEALEAEITERT
jgi:hypothetical protein